MEAEKTSRRSFPREVVEAPPQTMELSLLFHAIVGMLAGASVLVAGLVFDPVVSILHPAWFLRGQIDEGIAYSALALVVIGLCILFASATATLRVKSASPTKGSLTSPFTTLGKVLGKKSYSRALLLSAALYAIFYSFASGIIVYNANVNFSTIYHVPIPSSAVATCCSPLGQTPLLVVYLTEHFGILIIPVNLLLLFLISWLVGLNAASAAFLLSVRRTTQGVGWFSGVGALAGLFTSCPTCAGLAIFSILGGTGSLSAAILLGPLQTIFAGLSITILVATAILSARSIRSLEEGVCTRR